MLPTPLRVLRALVWLHVVVLTVVLAVGLAAFAAAEREGGTNGSLGVGILWGLGVAVAGFAAAALVFLVVNVRRVRDDGGRPAATALGAIVVAEATVAVLGGWWALRLGADPVWVGPAGVPVLAVVLLVLAPSSRAWIRRASRS